MEAKTSARATRTYEPVWAQTLMSASGQGAGSPFSRNSLSRVPVGNFPHTER